MIIEVGPDGFIGVFIELQDELLEDTILYLSVLDHLELILEVSIALRLILRV